MKKLNLFSNVKSDALAGIIVFLIALPLCLGIAQASGAPLFSGLVAGIVGGIVVGALSGSQLSVVGPAAGLTAIVLVAIPELGGFQTFLCAVIVAGLIQILLGFARAGSIANYIPNSVIEGMLAGIGLTIIIKQVPEALGYDGKGHERMVDADDGFTWDYVSTAFNHMENGAIIIAAVGLALLILWTTKPFRKLQLIPAALVVVIIGTVINQLFLSNGSDMYLSDAHLVKIPVASSFGEFIGQFKTPNWSGFTSAAVWQTGAVIAAVASIETLLCVEATDKLDPLKRYTPTNRELKAQGIGNIVSGLIGGLPMTSVIVRSSANVNAGGKTKLSTIIHGALLLICVGTIPAILNMIPKATLAAILIYTGYKLCKPAMFVRIYKEGGLSQFIPLVVTTIAVVKLDLLKGVGIGLAISIFYMLRQNARIPFYFKKSAYKSGDVVKITLAQEVSFLNKASIKQTLESLPEGSNVVIDASGTEYIDFDVLELIKDFYETRSRERNIKLSLEGFKESYKIPKASRTETELVSEVAGSGEQPQETTGHYKDLLKELTDGNAQKN